MVTDSQTNLPVKVPRKATSAIEALRARLSPSEWDTIIAAINDWAEQTGTSQRDFFASNWNTGADWNTHAAGAFQPIYEAYREIHDDQERVRQAGFMLGWLVRQVMTERSDEWYLYKNPDAGSDDVPRQFWGTFYWRKNRE